jgi:hypothetical protein
MESGTALRTLLEELGGTADEVAARLEASGVHGVRNTARYLNPVVRYLRARLRGSGAIDLQLGDKARLTFGNGHQQAAVLPEAVRQFLVGFNRGDYPNLELP